MINFKRSLIPPTPFGLETWYVVETENQWYQVACMNVETVKTVVRIAQRLGIQIHELTVSEYLYDRECGNDKALVSSWNAEEFIGGK